MTLIGISETPGAMPAMPSPLSVSAAMIPEVYVPWPSRSVMSVLFHGSLRGCTTLTPSRSGWSRSAPVSRTATTSDGSPMVSGHTSGTPTWARFSWSA